MKNEKNNSAKVGPQVKGWTTEEKAQYEVYKNGTLSRETIGQWIKNDLGAAASFIHGCMSDKLVFDAMVDAYYKRYEALHDVKVDELHKPIANES